MNSDEEDDIIKSLKSAISAVQFHDYPTAHRCVLRALKTLTQ